MDFLSYPYPSKRMATFGKRGMVATSQPLAAQAGLEILKKGGNAVDAAIATAAALTVVEPTSNGIGGDAFAIVWMKDQMYGLNSSGPAPKSISIEAVKEKGFDQMPTFGLVPVTVPGVPAAWVALSKRFGRLPFKEVLAPPIQYAREGYPISPILGKYWEVAFKRYKETFKDPEYQHWFEVFAPKGRAPKIGEVWKSEEHANTLQEIANTEAESFYRGELAEKIDAFSKEHGGFIRKEDLADFYPEWVEPISTNYRGYDIWEIPPNGQGIVSLMGLNIVSGFQFSNKESVETYHKQIEAMKLALTDGKAFITDPKNMDVTVKELLSEDYAQSRRSLISQTAIEPVPFTPQNRGTVYLATADGEGNMVSYIQSNYMGFGSGIVIPGTGIALQNRGADFSLDLQHNNALKPGKKTYHTIIPGFITYKGKAIGPFGVMGGYMQPQGHMQVVMNLLDFKLNPQSALDAPRWQWIGGKKVLVEPDFPIDIAQALVRKGHQIQVSLDYGAFGRGQVIWRTDEGILIGGTEKRTDGAIAVW